MSTAKRINARQARFVTEYLIDLNATKAAVRAGYSEKSAEKIGSRLLGNPGVSAALSEKQGQRLKRRDITAERVLDEIAKIAFLDPRKLFTSDGSLVPIHELDDDTAASVAGLEVNELSEGEGDQKHAFGLQKKVKIADKLRGLEMLGKHLKLFVEKIELDGKLDFEVQDVKQKLLAKLNCRTAKGAS